jgi:hypothetical protein
MARGMLSMRKADASMRDHDCCARNGERGHVTPAARMCRDATSHWWVSRSIVVPTDICMQRTGAGGAAQGGVAPGSSDLRDKSACRQLGRHARSKC